MRAVQTPVIPVVGELIGSCPGTISLGQGVVSYGPPKEATEAIGRFLKDPENHKYRLVQGIPELLAGMKTKLELENGVEMSGGREVVVTAGANMGFMNAVLAITDPGDEIVLQSPYYFNQEMAVTMAGCRAVLVSTDADYQLRPGAIRRAVTVRTRAVVTISPNNPSGAVYSEEAIREVNEICREKGIYHIHDEAYEYFTYGEARHFSPGRIGSGLGHTILLYSLSKAYGFASWRIGYMVIPEELLGAVKKIQDTMLICPPVISQYAAVGALEAGAGYCREKLKAIAGVRAIVMGELEKVRDWCSVPEAEGAFYFLVRVNTGLDAMELTERLIREHGVAVIPGTAFGMNDGCHLRIAYGALTREKAAEGIGRLVKGLKQICG